MIWRYALTLIVGLALTVGPAIAKDAPDATVHNSKRIALTFDDIPRNLGAFYGSHGERTDDIIAALGDQQAAFFLNPGKIADRPGAEARIAAYVAAGHVIANHSATHPQLRATAPADYLANIDRAEDWLKGRAGYRPWFRFPYLDEGGDDKGKRDAIRAGLAERGLRNGYVTVDASDWFYEQAAINAKRDGHQIDMDALRDLYVETHVKSAEFSHDLALRTLGRAPAQILLLHETDLAGLYLADLIRALQANGWAIISADEAFADPIAQMQPDVPYAQGTLLEAIAWERDVPAPRWYEPNNTKIADAFFRSRVLGLDPTLDPKLGPKLNDETQDAQDQ